MAAPPQYSLAWLFCQISLVAVDLASLRVLLADDYGPKPKLAAACFVILVSSVLLGGMLRRYAFGLLVGAGLLATMFACFWLGPVLESFVSSLD